MNSFIVSAFSSSYATRQFQYTGIRRRESAFAPPSPSATAADSVVAMNAANSAVSRISVCTGELCQCQGEQYEYTGGAAFAVMEGLKNIGLPFPIDEVGCMGACGMGTMVAIDYENGVSIMTDGLESTLVELGIQPQPQKQQVVLEPSSAIPETEIVDGATTSNSHDKHIEIIPEPEMKPPLLADARDRMRTEAKSEVENPWMNMASYLAKKAMEKIRGSE